MTILEPIEHTNRDFVGSLAKGLKVLAAFNADADQMTVADVARVTDMTRAGARRLLLTLHALGYVKSNGKTYSLTPKVLELGFSYLSSQSWLSIASPMLEQLRDELDESVSVTVLEHTEVVYVARFQVDRVMTMSMDIGARKPAFCTAMGRVLLGVLPENQATAILAASDIRQYTDQTVTDIAAIMQSIRQAQSDGFALINRELENSLVAISVPLKNYHGETLAAVNVCGHPSSLSIEDLQSRCLHALQNTSRRISQMLV